MRAKWALRQTALTVVLTLAAVLAAGLPQLRWDRAATLPGARAGAAEVQAVSGVFILALDQRDYARSAVFWWAGWAAAPVKLMEAGANPQLALDKVTGRLYLADTEGSGIAARDRLRVYDLTPGEQEGKPPRLQLRQEAAVTDRARYKEPAFTPFLGLQENGGPVYLSGGTGVSNLDYTSWVDGYDPKSLQVKVEGQRYPGLMGPRLLVPRGEGPIRAVLWTGTRFLALDPEGAVAREWTAASPAASQQVRVVAADIAVDGQRVYAFRPRALEWFAWDKSWTVNADLGLPEGWQVAPGAVALAPDGARLYVGVGPKEQASRGTFVEVRVLSAVDGQTLEQVQLKAPAEGLAASRDGRSLILWDRHHEAVSVLEVLDWKASRQGKLEGWVPVWAVP